MHSMISRAAVAIALLSPAMVLSCTADVHDNVVNVDDPDVDFNTDVDVDNVQQGQTIVVNVEAGDAHPVPPDQTPPPEHADTAVFFKIHLDDDDSEPLVITADTKISVKIPDNTEPGDHKLICRVHHHDGTATDAKSEIKIKVKARVSTTTG